MMDVLETRHSILVTEFDRYVVEHPEFAEKIPRNAQIVLQVEGDEEYNNGKIPFFACPSSAPCGSIPRPLPPICLPIQPIMSPPDELPQLYSIVKGDMSFVGPRPALFNQDDLVALRTARGIYHLVPGLTGWAQINGRDELPIPVKVDLEEYYLRQRSLFFDLKIIFMTFVRVLRKDGVHH